MRPSRFLSRVTALAVALGVTGALAVTAAATANAAIAAPSPDICNLGYVWRQAIPSDHVCVTPATRTQTWNDNAAAPSRVNPTGPYGPDTCVQGYVWREAYSSADHVCVTPDVRSQAAYDNTQAGVRAIGNGITMTWNNITFNNGVPVGGWVSLTVYGNGQYEFSGHFHDSGFTSYNTNTVWAFRSGDGTVFTFTDSGHEAGTAELTFGGGSRDHDWDNTGTNGQLQADWPAIQQQGWSWQATANTSLDVGTLFSEIKQVIGYVQTVVNVVGAIVG